MPCSRLPFEFSTDWCINRRKFRFGFRQIYSGKSIHPDYHLLTAENTAKLQEKDSKFSLTVNEPEDIKKIKSFNVNGIISDFPDRI
jgi:glycerophosphoryl diester phosphodiesterase